MNIKYYWINIDKSVERREFMEKQFNFLNIDNQRISAITPTNLSNFIEDKEPYLCGYCECIENNGKNCKYEYSTLCSHLNAIKEGYNSNADYFIVCEDDIYLNIKLNFENIIKTLPYDFDIFQMVVITKFHAELLYKNFYKNMISYINHVPITPSAAFYLITHNGAKRILDLYTNKTTGKFDFQNSSFIKIADVLIYLSVNTYVSTIPLCIPNINFKSQIHEEHSDFHKQAQEKILEVLSNIDIDKNPFIIHYYSIEDFDRLQCNVK
jgi:GR25 family glycosyltransferase involved in LPS biosynthesis